MREISDQRFERLERQVRRLRGVVLVMAAGISGILLTAATNEPDELTLRRLAIVDAEGRERIVAQTSADGTASVTHFDREGRTRITGLTSRDGGAGLSLRDRAGENRIIAGTMPDGSATLLLVDRTGKSTWSESSQ